MKKLFWAKSFPVFFLLAGMILSCTSSPDGDTLSADYYNLARDFQELGEYDRAEYYYELCLERDRDDRESRYNLALMYLSQGKADDALSQLKKLKGYDDSHRAVLNSMAIAYSLKEEWEEALELYDQVLKEFPWDETALYNGALIYTKQEEEGSDELALQWLEKLWERDKSYQTAMALWERSEDRIPSERLLILEEAETSTEEELLELNKKKFDLYLDAGLKEEALSLTESLKSGDEDKAGWYWFKEGELLLTLYRTEEGMAAIRESFRKGFKDNSELEKLYDQLAPSLMESIKMMESLYFSE
ncbi:MAG: tetratricopeptide repeat protein [Spirochaetales bacterium]|nr:tetratricopeptide repeat protein [Spirochaetales bacterium]